MYGVADALQATAAAELNLFLKLLRVLFFTPCMAKRAPLCLQGIGDRPLEKRMPNAEQIRMIGFSRRNVACVGRNAK